jgi:ATP-dependent DNA helicase PIF1
MRARSDPWFSEFLLRVGDGIEEMIEGDYIRILEDMVIPYTEEKESKERLIKAIFPSLELHENSSEYTIMST